MGCRAVLKTLDTLQTVKTITVAKTSSSTTNICHCETLPTVSLESPNDLVFMCEVYDVERSGETSRNPARILDIVPVIFNQTIPCIRVPLVGKYACIAS